MNRRFLLPAVLCIMFFSAGAISRSSDFGVRTLAGEDAILSTYFEPGKWTIVMIWTTYCATCRTQYPIISAFHDKHKNTDAKVIGISLDGYEAIDKVREYVASNPMTFDSAVAEVAAMRDAYLKITEENFTGTPTYLLFDPSGAMVAHAPGPMAVENIEQFIAEYNL